MTKSFNRLYGLRKINPWQRIGPKINCPFVHLDNKVEEQMGMRIEEAIEKYGELYFRKQEHLALEKVLKSLPESVVVATGGGTPGFYDHMELLKLTAKPYS